MKCLQRSARAVAAVLIVLIPGVAARGQQPAYPLTTVAGTSPPVEFVGVDSAQRLTFRPPALEGAEQPRELVVPLDELISWGHSAEHSRGPLVVLVDGSVIAAQTVTADGDMLELTSAVFNSRTVPLEHVRGVVFQSPGGPARRDRLFESVASPAAGDRDRLSLVGGDELLGTILALDARGVDLKLDMPGAAAGAEATRVELSRVAALVFNPALAQAAPQSGLRLAVGLRDGSLVVAAPPQSREDWLDLRPWSIAALPEFASWPAPRSHVVFLQTLGGRARYLSDLEPLGYRHVPYLTREWTYGADRSVSGGELRVGGKRYLKGLGMHSTARLTYAIGDARRFEASAAIDDETEGRGSVTFRVFVDAEERYRGEIVRGGQPPTPIAVDVAGGKQLSLVVDFADFADEQDHADWLNARLLP